MKKIEVFGIELTYKQIANIVGVSYKSAMNTINMYYKDHPERYLETNGYANREQIEERLKELKQYDREAKNVYARMTDEEKEMYAKMNPERAAELSSRSKTDNVHKAPEKVQKSAESVQKAPESVHETPEKVQDIENSAQETRNDLTENKQNDVEDTVKVAPWQSRLYILNNIIELLEYLEQIDENGEGDTFIRNITDAMKDHRLDKYLCHVDWKKLAKDGA